MRRASNRADKKPTWSSLILELLKASDDFLNLDQIKAATGASNNQATATLTYLCRRHAIECVDSGNRLWWFATAESDDRMRTHDLRVEEPKGNRVRGAKKPIILPSHGMLGRGKP